MNLFMTKPGVLVNLDQAYMIEVVSTEILFHFIGVDRPHKVEKNRLQEGEWERITKALHGKTA